MRAIPFQGLTGMAKKFSSLLVRDNVVSIEKMEEALQRQVIFGGRLGTNLLEMGIIAEEELNHYLAQAHNLRPATHSLLTDVDPDALETLDIDTIEHLGVLPVQLKPNGDANVLVLDALSGDQIEQLRIRTGFQFIQHVTPEFRFRQALQRFYERPFSGRVARLLERFPLKMKLGSRSHITASTIMKARPTPKRRGTSRREVVLGQGWTAQEVSAYLRDCYVRDVILAVVLGYAAGFAARRMLLVVLRHRLQGYAAAGQNVPGDELRKVRLRIRPGGAIERVCRGDTYYQGPPEDGELVTLFEAMNIPAPSNCVLLPVPVGPRAALVLLMDQGMRTFDTHELEPLFHTINDVSEALERIIRLTKSGELPPEELRLPPLPERLRRTVQPRTPESPNPSPGANTKAPPKLTRVRTAPPTQVEDDFDATQLVEAIAEAMGHNPDEQPTRDLKEKATLAQAKATLALDKITLDRFLEEDADTPQVSQTPEMALAASIVEAARARDEARSEPAPVSVEAAEVPEEAAPQNEPDEAEAHEAPPEAQEPPENEPDEAPEPEEPPEARELPENEPEEELPDEEEQEEPPEEPDLAVEAPEEPPEVFEAEVPEEAAPQNEPDEAEAHEAPPEAQEPPENEPDEAPEPEEEDEEGLDPHEVPASQGGLSPRATLTEIPRLPGVGPDPRDSSVHPDLLNPEPSELSDELIAQGWELPDLFLEGLANGPDLNVLEGNADALAAPIDIDFREEVEEEPDDGEEDPAPPTEHPDQATRELPSLDGAPPPLAVQASEEPDKEEEDIGHRDTLALEPVSGTAPPAENADQFARTTELPSVTTPRELPPEREDYIAAEPPPEQPVLKVEPVEVETEEGEKALVFDFGEAALEPDEPAPASQEGDEPEGEAPEQINFSLVDDESDEGAHSEEEVEEDPDEGAEPAEQDDIEDPLTDIIDISRYASKIDDEEPEEDEGPPSAEENSGLRPASKRAMEALATADDAEADTILIDTSTIEMELIRESDPELMARGSTATPEPQFAPETEQALYDWRPAVDKLVGHDAAEREIARRSLLESNGRALPALLERFPGRVVVDRYAYTAQTLPPISEHSTLLEVLVEMGDLVAPAIASFLTVSSVEVRFYATFFFSRVRFEPIIPLMMGQLFDNDGLVREIAQQILRSYKGTEAFKLVLLEVRRALSHGDSFHKEQAARAARVFGDTLTVPYLIELLDNENKHVAKVANRTLRALSFEDLGQSKRKWTRWWERNASNPRHAWLVEALNHSQRDIRALAAKELNHHPGLFVNYSPDAPRRERVRAQQVVAQYFKDGDNLR